MNNKAISIHVTQLSFFVIFRFNIIIPKFIDKHFDQGIQAYSILPLSFSFLLPISFHKNVWLYGNLVLTLIYFFFLTFFIVFPKTELFINLKNFFSKSFPDSVLNLVFISILGFSHASCLNSITLCTFLNINP